MLTMAVRYLSISIIGLGTKGTFGRRFSEIPIVPIGKRENFVSFVFNLTLYFADSKVGSGNM